MGADLFTVLILVIRLKPNAIKNRLHKKRIF